MVDDTNPDLYALGGKLALSEDNPDLAETYLQKALKIDPEDQGNMLAWSNFLVQEERDQENIDFLVALINPVMLIRKSTGIWPKATIGLIMYKKPGKITC